MVEESLESLSEYAKITFSKDVMTMSLKEFKKYLDHITYNYFKGGSHDDYILKDILHYIKFYIQTIRKDQTITPEQREKLRDAYKKILMLSDTIVKHGIYKASKRSMPEYISRDHDFLYRLYGLPTIQSTDSKPENKQSNGSKK